jgi:hypothetical protein
VSPRAAAVLNIDDSLAAVDTKDYSVFRRYRLSLRAAPPRRKPSSGGCPSGALRSRKTRRRRCVCSDWRQHSVTLVLERASGFSTATASG